MEGTGDKRAVLCVRKNCPCEPPSSPAEVAIAAHPRWYVDNTGRYGGANKKGPSAATVRPVCEVCWRNDMEEMCALYTACRGIDLCSVCDRFMLNDAVRVAHPDSDRACRICELCIVAMREDTAVSYKEAVTAWLAQTPAVRRGKAVDPVTGRTKEAMAFGTKDSTGIRAAVLSFAERHRKDREVRVAKRLREAGAEHDELATAVAKKVATRFVGPPEQIGFSDLCWLIHLDVVLVKPRDEPASESTSGSGSDSE